MCCDFKSVENRKVEKMDVDLWVIRFEDSKKTTGERKEIATVPSGG